MDPAVAAKLVSALDQELARRRRVRDEAEEKAWREEDPDPVAFLARYLERFANRLHEPSPPVALELSDRDREMQRRQLEDIAEQVTELAERLESQFPTRRLSGTVSRGACRLSLGQGFGLRIFWGRSRRPMARMANRRS
jgi:hypothetical protein